MTEKKIPCEMIDKVETPPPMQRMSENDIQMEIDAEEKAQRERKEGWEIYVSELLKYNTKLRKRYNRKRFIDKHLRDILWFSAVMIIFLADKFM